VIYIFEGIDGCGKTSLINALEGRLNSNGFKVKSFSDGVGLDESVVAENMRSALKQSNDDISKLMMIQIIRIELYNEIIKYQSKNPDAIILLSRSTISSAVYNDNRDTDYVYANIISTTPYLGGVSNVFYLKCSPEVAFNRDPSGPDYSKTSSDNNNKLVELTRLSTRYDNVIRSMQIILDLESNNSFYYNFNLKELTTLNAEDSIDNLSNVVYSKILRDK
jgi:thymidylate kinase